MPKIIKSIRYYLCSLTLLTQSSCQSIGILNPKGLVAYEERKLLFDTVALMLIVVLPVIIMSITFVQHYRHTQQREYRPNWAHSYLLETIWWLVPCGIIFLLAIITWKSTHELDPYRRLSGDNNKPILIQAISLPWKWLFIYPEYDIATLNYLQIPVGRQIEFWLTADNAAMTAFFIPQLGSQIYAMAGMRTRLHLIANEIGTYDGMNALYNGEGFSDMHFLTHVVSVDDMEKWVSKVKQSPDTLTQEAYLKLLKPSTYPNHTAYKSVTPNLFNNVLHVYMKTDGVNHPRQHEANWYKE